MTRVTRSILVVEDDEVFRNVLLGGFRARGFRAIGARDTQEALRAAKDDRPNMAVVDLRLPDGSGLEVVRALKGNDASVAIVVLTGYGSIATALESIRLGAVHYLTKPTDINQILAAFEKGLASSQQKTAVETPSLDRVEWEHIQRVLADCHGSISQAARSLGMHRRSLQRKLAKYPVRK